ncbi:hypothetical protein PG996_001701 [Apiospora saccharicola]|uniref:Uncharacterized protein n=1 Tax=Apiospora saccharicola TaxID=335842 RepID=A0ABR1WHE1_9PEZI
MAFSLYGLFYGLILDFCLGLGLGGLDTQTTSAESGNIRFERTIAKTTLSYRAEILGVSDR